MTAAAGASEGRSPKRQRRAQGFTLVELIAVIIILGILAAVIVPQYMGLSSTVAQTTSKAAGSEAIARLREATNLHLIQTGALPTQLSDISGSLSLDGSNSANLGDYTATYTAVASNSTMTIDITAHAASTVLYSTNTPWP